MRLGLMPSGGLARVTAWSLLLVSAIYLLLIGGGYWSLVSLPGKVAIQAVAGGAIGLWLVGCVLRPAWRPSSPLLIPVLVLLASYLLSALVSERPRLSFPPAVAGVAFALGFLFLTRLAAEPWFRRRLAALTVASVGFVAWAYVLQVVVEWVRWWALIGEFAIPPLRPSWAGLAFLTPNIVAAYLLIAGPLAVALLAKGSSRSLIPIVFGGTILFALFLTGSRSAWASLVVAALFVLAFHFRRRRAPRLWDHALQLRRRPARAAFAAGFTVLLAAAVLPAVAHRFQQGGDDVRLELWRTALAVFAEHPWLGSGPGTWVQLKVFETPPDVPNLIFSNAHNMYVQALAELGLVGVAAQALVAVAVARRLREAISGPEDGLRVDGLAVAFGLVAFAGQAVFDSLTNVPVIGLLLIWLVAWIDSGLGIRSMGGSRRDGGPSGELLGRLAAAGGLVAIALVAPTVVRMDIAWFHQELGNDAAGRQDWPAAVREFEAALSWDPDLALYQIQAASAQAQLGNLETAHDLLSRAVETDGVAINRIGLAALASELGMHEAAVAEARRAVDAGFEDATVALNAGLIAEAVGDDALALQQFANAVAWSPPLAGSDFWSAPERQVSALDVIGAAVERSEPLEAVLILAYAGEVERAAAALAGVPAPHDRLIAEAVVAWQGGAAETALSQLRSMLQDDHLDWVAAAWASRIARDLGDPALYLKYANWALAVQGDSAPSLILERSAIPPIYDAASAGLPRSYPSGIYLRSPSPYMLMPQLTLIGVR